MSIAVGTIVFCLTVPIVLVLGSILFGAFGWLDGGGLIPTGFAVLFVFSVLMGLTVAILTGRKYYRHLKMDQ